MVRLDPRDRIVDACGRVATIATDRACSMLPPACGRAAGSRRPASRSRSGGSDSIGHERRGPCAGPHATTVQVALASSSPPCRATSRTRSPHRPASSRAGAHRRSPIVVRRRFARRPQRLVSGRIRLEIDVSGSLSAEPARCRPRDRGCHWVGIATVGTVGGCLACRTAGSRSAGSVGGRLRGDVGRRWRHRAASSAGDGDRHRAVDLGTGPGSRSAKLTVDAGLRGQLGRGNRRGGSWRRARGARAGRSSPRRTARACTHRADPSRSWDSR